MPANYRVGSSRAANAVNANSQRMESESGERYATGRNVKCAGPNRTYDIVESWTLKRRENGRAVTVERNVTRERAIEWVNG